MSRGPAYDAPAANDGQASPSPSLEERGRRRARAATTPIPASPSSSSSAALPVGPLSPAVNARARVLASEGRRRATSDTSRPGGYSAEELSAQATRLRERIGVGRGWVDPAGRLRALPHGARLPPPPSLTEEDLARARALSPTYPRGPSPPPPPPQTEEEYMRGVEERANEYHAF
ncbi:hypothetical protein CGMCC3_g8598 [Colletotrichum fructicola]|nr:uncharacterized protein CGMCC3_g8598 [Colletotrichum fructicola]KAE9575157.1 hypothetical protein CGMCC3_g8598 [Colletotrichum fructicola]